MRKHGWAAQGWKPGKGLPTIEQLQKSTAQIDDVVAERPWIAGRVRVDTFRTNYLVNALASLLVQHRILREDEIDYYVAMTEYQSKVKLEETSRTPPPDWKAPEAAKILVPGKDF